MLFLIMLPTCPAVSNRYFMSFSSSFRESIITSICEEMESSRGEVMCSKPDLPGSETPPGFPSG